jgi:hypothetical protein
MGSHLRGPGALCARPLGQLTALNGDSVCAVGGSIRWLRQGSDAPCCLEKVLSLRSHG